MTEKVMYPALLWLPDEEGADFGVSFPDFPGCVSAGKDEAKAVRNAEEALIFHIEGMLEDGDAIPKASSLPSVLDQTDKGWQTQKIEETFARNFVVVYVAIPKPQKAVRFNIHASAAELMRIDKAAEKLGKPRSRFLIESALEKAEKAQYGVADQEQEIFGNAD